MLDPASAGEEWLIGTAVTVKADKGFGFIRPEVALPPPFHQCHQVFFHFTTQKGPRVTIDTIVQFQLDTTKDPRKAAAKAVKQLGWTGPDRPEPQRRSRSRSRNHTQPKMTLMEIDSSSRENLNSDAGNDETAHAPMPMELANVWLSGKVVSFRQEARHGFIRPDELLPPPFKQRKDIHFNTYAIKGPSVVIGEKVEFQLNLSGDPEKPAAKSVKPFGYIITENKENERRGRSRSRNRGSSEMSLMDFETTPQEAEGMGEGAKKKEHSQQKRKAANDSDKLFSGLANINDDGEAKSKLAKNENKSMTGKRSDFISRIKGKVAKIIEDKRIGFIKPLVPMPQGYAEDQDIFFKAQYVENGGLPIKANDILEFTLGTQDKSRPMAMSTKVVQFSARRIKDIENYLDELNKILHPAQNASDPKIKMSTKESEVLCRVLACEALWMCIGETRDTSEELTCLIISILLRIEKIALGMQHAFNNVLQTMSRSHFFDPWSGPIRAHIRANTVSESGIDHLGPLKELLMMIVTKVPEKSPAIVTLLKPLISSDKTSMEHYLYQLLRQSTQHCSASIDDLPWENLPLVPSVEELTTGPLENTSSLQPVKTKGPYESAEEYMDVYFRLLRADCFDNLRKGVRAFLDGKLDTRDMNVYHSIKLVGIQLTNQDSGLAVALQLVPLRPVKNWATSSNLMFGNLLCLSLSNSFRDPVWATVVNRDVKLLQAKGVIVVELCSENNTMSDSAVITQLSHGSGRIIAVESPTYYRAYQPVLKALQKMDPEDFPFHDQLVKVEPAQTYPDYIGPSTTIDSTILHNTSPHHASKEVLSDALMGDTSTCTLDNSQFVALSKAIISKVGVIQGPPGTGKTYIGIKIVDMILSMSTAPDAPILVLTYKNHSLDEFLKAFVDKYPKAVARVGGRCKEPALEKCNLSELRKSQKKSQALSKLFTQKYSEADELRPMVKKCSRFLDEACTYSRRTLLEWATPDQVLSLLLGCTWTNTSLQWPTKHGFRKMTMQDVSNQLDKLTDTGKDICSFLLSPPADEKYQNLYENMGHFLDAAMKQWYPSAATVLEVEESLGTYSSVDLDAVEVKGTDDNPIMDDLHDEKDIEDMEKERMAAVSNKAIQSADIIEFHSGRKSKTDPCLFSTAKHVINKIPIAKLMNCGNLWELGPPDRVKYVQCLLMRQIESPQEEFERYLSQYQQVCAAKNELDTQHSLSLLRSKKLIGMTITGASIHQNLLAALQPAVVLVEEAAEVLEPQLIAALGKSVQHLILIGDHKQLRPPVESFALRRNYHFDVSMMERLINNNTPFSTLQMQNRMRPEFSNLLRDIYPDLRDNLERVSGNVPPACLEKSMYFWDHDDPEKGGRSYWNEGEAERAVRLCLYLLQQGYEPKQITILGAYQGQTSLLRSKIREAEKQYTDLFPVDPDSSKDGDKKEFRVQRIEIHTIDLYQGDENDVVIVSLVRSNKKNVTGFLKLMNRRCVAQSRSRCGLYFIGNSRTVCSVNHWKKMVQKMSDQSCFGSTLTLICSKHPVETKVQVTTGGDITLGSFCKKPCSEVMVCKLHFCPLFCQPRHSHTYCSFIVDFKFKRCQHSGKKKFSKPEDEMKCKEPCNQVMDCKKHICDQVCDPPHQHTYCAERVDFTYKKCGHQDTKHCSQKEEELPPCKVNVVINHPACSHLVEKECHQADDKARCKHKCMKKLTCTHPCPNKCGQTCLDAKNCKVCEKIAQEEEKKRLKMEQEAIKKHKDLIQQEIDEIKKAPLPEVSRVDLAPSGDTAAEYLRVEDRVKRYVQPMHNWFPKVKRIEKVTNMAQHQKYLEVQKKLFDPVNRDTLFHGTSTEVVDLIIDNGFLLPKKGAKNMFGQGVYFATDSSKSAQNIYTKGSNMLLLCEVLLGKSLTVRGARTMDAAMLRKDGYDSLFAIRGSEKEKGVLNDEFVVYDPRQAIVRYVIHYECTEVEGDTLAKLSFLSNPPAYKKHTLLPKRNLDPSDPLDINFRIAESQFLRLVTDRKLQYKLKSVQYHENPKLISKFKSKADAMKLKYPKQKEADYVLAFHGTKSVANLDAIVKDNFDVSKLSQGSGDQGWYGAGIYFSEFPDVSLAYGKEMLLCMLLPGKSLDLRRTERMDGEPLKTGYDSHRVQADNQGRGEELVIFDPDQILPCYVLEIQ